MKLLTEVLLASSPTVPNESATTETELVNPIYSDLLDEQQGLQKGCTLGALLKVLDPELSEGIIQALADKRIDGTLIADLLDRKGFNISSHTVNRHRRGGCTCGKRKVAV